MASQPARLVPRWLWISVLVVAIVGVAQSLIPIPYVIERPGPVVNTLGEVTIAGETTPMIEVDGAETYPVTGELNLLTVSIAGSPTQSVTFFELFAAMIDPTQEIVPMEEIYPSGLTPEERKEENEAEMTSSQDLATAAALTELGIPFGQTLSVAGVGEDGPSAGILREGDVFVSLNGEEITDYTRLRELIAENGDSKPADIVVIRDGETTTVQVTPVRVTEGGESTTLIGVGVQTEFEFPFQVSIQVDQIGGPSAGLMFALGITDLLTPENLTAGRIVSGTGTIDAEGNVGAIGGLPQKVIAAERANSALMFIPADQCAEIPSSQFDRIRIVPVATLSEAVDSLELLRENDDTSLLNSCTLGSSAVSADYS